MTDSWIRLSFTPVEEVADVVGVLERAGFPVKGPRERYFVLHEGAVGHLHDTRSTSRVIVTAHTAELMMWFYGHHDACVACSVAIEPERVTVRLNLEGASDADVVAVARAVDTLIEFLVDPEVVATVPTAGIG